MAAPALAMWGGFLGWAGLHGMGGVIGGAIGITLTKALTARGIPTHYVVREDKVKQFSK